MHASSLSLFKYKFSIGEIVCVESWGAHLAVMPKIILLWIKFNWKICFTFLVAQCSSPGNGEMDQELCIKKGILQKMPRKWDQITCMDGLNEWLRNMIQTFLTIRSYRFVVYIMMLSLLLALMYSCCKVQAAYTRWTIDSLVVPRRKAL